MGVFSGDSASGMRQLICIHPEPNPQQAESELESFQFMDQHWCTEVFFFDLLARPEGWEMADCAHLGGINECVAN